MNMEINWKCNRKVTYHTHLQNSNNLLLMALLPKLKVIKGLILRSVGLYG